MAEEGEKKLNVKMNLDNEMEKIFSRAKNIGRRS
jgi:hypothetical protein